MAHSHEPPKTFPVKLQSGLPGPALSRLFVPGFAFLTTTLAVACGGTEPGADPNSWQASMDTVGQTITVRTLAGSDWGGEASLIPELVIGELDGPEEYLFGEVRSVEVGEDGTIFVLDVHVPAVRVFDSDGIHLRTIGKEGNGPGEYKSPDGMAILPDGRVLVRDPPNGRITVYDAEGHFLEQWPLAGGFNTDRRFYVDQKGRSFANTILERGTSPWDWTYGVVVYSPAGEILDTIPAPTWDYDLPRLTASNENSSTARGVPYHPIPTWTFSPLGYMVGGLPTEYRIDLNRSDSSILSIEKVHQAVPVLSGEADERRQSMTRSLRRRFPGWSWNGPPIPDQKPPFKEIFTSREGDIWVSLSTEGKPLMTDGEAAEEERVTGNRPLRFSEPIVFDVFTSDGRYLGQVPTPESFRLEPEPVVRGNHVWAVTRDDLDIPRVVRFRIVPPEEKIGEGK